MLYNPPHFRQTDIDPLLAAIGAHGFAMLLSNGPQGPIITHLPLFHVAAGGALGRLIGHVARANPHWKTADLSLPSVAVFNGPDAYVSPGWYPSKVEHGKAVPTWNYQTIHATGWLKIHEDAGWLRNAVSDLTDRHERGRANPWSLGEAPEDFIQSQLKGIVGVELELTGIDGKAKLSQNRAEPDRQGVIDGLAGEPGVGAAGIRAEMLRRR